MFAKKSLLAPAFGAAITLAAASAAVAASGGQSYAQKFTAKRPGQPTGVTFRAAGPVQANSVTLTFPKGTKINTAALTRCANTANCPPASKIGSGTATVSFAGATPSLPVTAYNRAGGMVLVVAIAPTPVVLEPTLSGRKLQVSLPALSLGGVPISVTGLQLTVSKIASGHKAYIKTPSRCPSSGRWLFTGSFTYPSAPPRTIKSLSACKKH